MKFLLSLFLASSVFASLPSLKVAADHRHLVTEDGKPFFYLADTAWELFHRLTIEEADLFLRTRAAQGFNVINAVALAEYDVSVPNAYGELPLENFDPTKPREAYFQHVDAIVNKAEALGLYIAFLPTWGDKWNKKWGKGPEIFTPENARVYGEWLGKRYRDKPIIWTLGGDRPVETDRHREIIRAMAAGLKAGDGGRHLITFHPQGRKNSSDYWPDEPWLDFHQFQSGHAAQDQHNFDYNAKNLALKALKPTFDGEPNYEDHPVRGIAPKTGVPTVWFDDYDSRRAAWWSVLSGACGHCYGDHSVWQFYAGKREPVFFARTPWPQAIEYPGAKQMGIMRRFFEKLDWQKLVRDDDLLLHPEPGQPTMGAVAEDHSFAVIYFPQRIEARPAIRLEKLGVKSRAEVQFSGFDPATGENLKVNVSDGGDTALAEVAEVPNPHQSKELKDWVLLIEKKHP